MASLTAEAQAAREEATRVRAEAEELRLAVRGNLVRSRARLGRARAESDRARATRDEPLPSPWSELDWTHAYESLELTLVPLVSGVRRAGSAS